MSSRFLKEPLVLVFFWGKKSISEISEPLVLSCFGTQNKPSDPGFLKISKELTDLMKEPTKN
jgi:hypothetical protein